MEEKTSKIRVEPHHDFMVLGNISPLLSLSETLLTEVAVTVLMVQNNLVNLNKSHPAVKRVTQSIMESTSTFTSPASIVDIFHN